MYRFIGRFADLVLHLFDDNGWNSLSELSEKTGYPKSTIWRDLEFLETILPEGWSFEKDDSRGIFLTKPENGTFESLLVEIRAKNEYFQIFMLIVMNNGVDISQITEEVHISRSTAYRHLEKIKEIINQAGVSLSLSPFKLEGEEKKIRRFIMGVIEFMTFDPSTDKNSFKTSAFQSTLLNLGDKYSISFKTGALQRLTMYMYISNLRISMRYFIGSPAPMLNSYLDTKYYNFSKELIHFMVKCPTREIQLQEILAFVIYLLSEERPSNRLEYLKNIKSLLKTEKCAPVVKFFEVISDYVGFNLAEDDLFLCYFFQKLKRMLIESEFEIGTGRGPLLQYIHYFNTNPSYKKIGEIATQIFLENAMKVREIDILDIFILIQAAILRKKNQLCLKVALICRSIIEKEYILEILKFHFGNKLTISDIEAFSTDLRYKYDDFDLIISTDNRSIHIDHVPTIMISSVPSLSELNKIRKFLDKHFFEQYDLNVQMVYPFAT